MNFKDNLQVLRKRESLSQEQLAEKLNVSRQAVSKWETGDSSPEIDKLLQICDLFNCTMDELVKGEIKVKEKVTIDSNDYDKKMNTFSKCIASGVSLILIGVAILIFLSSGLGEDSTIPVAVFMTFVLVAVSMFIYSGIMHGDIDKEYKDNKPEYSKEEKMNFKKKLALAITSGVALILIGVIILIVVENPASFNREELERMGVITGGLFMLLVAVAVYLFVYFGIQASKYDNNNYNYELNPKQKEIESKNSKISGVIMLTATMIFLFCGFVFGLWHIAWIVFPLGGILCGIVATILGVEDK